MYTNPKRRSFLAGFLTMAMLFSMAPPAFAAQESGYHDPADHWQQAGNRTNELDANAVVTQETMFCYECGRQTSFTCFRTPEYSRTGVTALNHGVKYSDGTTIDGVGTGNADAGTPGQDGYYTSYHWSKAVCETCGIINSNMAKTDYGFDKNVYWLYDCAGQFTQELPETETIEQVDRTYHRVTTTGGTYCGFCFGTHKTEDTNLVRHTMDTKVRAELAHQRFVRMDTCTGCGYAETSYTAAKAVVADYFGVVDGQPHTVTVSDLSEAGVQTAIRYGHSADACTLTSAPNFTEAGTYPVYYEIVYRCEGTEMSENGVAYVHLRSSATAEDGSCTCGCGNPDCGCQDPSCEGDCCADACGEDHNWTLLDSTPASCLTLGYDRYLCTDCGQIEKRNYTAAQGHAYQSVVVREATCDTPGKTLDLCECCGNAKESTLPQTEHEYSESTVKATCTSPGYTLRECAVCGERQIADITPALAHTYTEQITPATCESGGKTVHLCAGCGSSFVTDYKDPLGHAWDEGTAVTNATCTGEGLTEYRCTRCEKTRLEGNTAAGHTPGDAATCTSPQLCLECGAVLQNAAGHAYETEVIAPTCTEMGYTTHTCAQCGDIYQSTYTNATGHTPSDWVIDQQSTLDSEGSRHKECTVCGEILEEQAMEKLYSQATTDSTGQAVVGEYLVIVTDTDTTAPIANATVSLHASGSLSIRLPDGRLLDYADQTTILVLLAQDETPVEGMRVAVVDANANSCMGSTDALGQLTVPGSTGAAGQNGNATVGWEDADGNRHTLTVQVERTETGRPIAGSEISVGQTGRVTVTLPDGQDMTTGNRVTVTVTDNQQTPQPGVTVIVKSDLGNTAQGQTNKDGKLTVPEVKSAYTEEDGDAVVGQYTVRVTDTEAQPIEGALVTLTEGKTSAEDSFAILLPDGRLLDAGDQTVVTVWLPDASPAQGLQVNVSDAQGNRAAKPTDANGQIIVPNSTGNAGETVGTENGENNTVNVDVEDQDGKPLEDAEVTVNDEGEVTVTLPEGFDFDEDGEVTVTVTDNQGQAKPDVPVTVTDGDGTTAAGQTSDDGQVTLPADQHLAYIVGYPDGTVGPERSMTRAEAAARCAGIVCAERGEEKDGQRSKFPDVDAAAWYADAVAYLENLGVLVGFDDGAFRPGDAITRAQFVAICTRLDNWMDLATYESAQGTFADVPGHHWAADAIGQATRNGWIVGYPDGKFHTDDPITRAEVVTIVNNLLGRTADVAFIRDHADSLRIFYDLQDPHHWAYGDLVEAANGHTVVTGAAAEVWHTVQ